MANKTTTPPASKSPQDQDPNFVYGDAPAKKKVEAWEGEGEVNLDDGSGEMALANLHFGTTPDADLLKTNQPEGTLESIDSTQAKAAHVDAVAVEVVENQEGALVASLSSTAVAGDDAAVYEVSDGRFEVVDGHLRLVDGVSLDFEDASQIEVTVTATNEGR